MFDLSAKTMSSLSDVMAGVLWADNLITSHLKLGSHLAEPALKPKDILKLAIRPQFLTSTVGSHMATFHRYLTGFPLYRPVKLVTNNRRELLQ